MWLLIEFQYSHTQHILSLSTFLCSFILILFIVSHNYISQRWQMCVNINDYFYHHIFLRTAHCTAHWNSIALFEIVHLIFLWITFEKWGRQPWHLLSANEIFFLYETIRMSVVSSKEKQNMHKMNLLSDFIIARHRCCFIVGLSVHCSE